MFFMENPFKIMDATTIVEFKEWLARYLLRVAENISAQGTTEPGLNLILWIMNKSTFR